MPKRKLHKADPFDILSRLSLVEETWVQILPDFWERPRYLSVLCPLEGGDRILYRKTSPSETHVGGVFQQAGPQIKKLKQGILRLLPWSVK